MHPRTLPHRAAFTLIEMLLAVALIAILARLVIPNQSPALHDQLQAAAQALANDLAYARSLAVANNSQYSLTFDLSGNRYTLSHSGTNSTLNTLPPAPIKGRYDTSTQQIFDLDDLPRLMAGGPRLYAVRAGTADVTTIDFASLGETMRTTDTVVWLAAGTGAAARYLSVTVNAVTGLATVGSFSASDPSASQPPPPPPGP